MRAEKICAENSVLYINRNSLSWVQKLEKNSLI